MATIKFKNISENEIDNLTEVFNFLAEGKRQNHINRDHLASLLKHRYNSKFWWPTKEEKEEWLRRWKEAPVETRHTGPSLKTPWDFGSWVDAFIRADIRLEDITINSTGEGELKFEQLALPSGGIEATEEIIRIFDGVILSNDAV